MRKAFQGVGNIVRFNWHFFILALLLIIILLSLISYFPYWLAVTATFTLILAIAGIIVSLAVSYFVYDLSDLYKLDWLKEFLPLSSAKILNIHAGFDESSELIATGFPNAKLIVLDFYNPTKHTEISIKRARKAYPPYPGTLVIDTETFSLDEDSVDLIVLMLAAHEIRNEPERIRFFEQLRNGLKASGTIIVMEHLRDLPNGLAYQLGFFHFLSKKSWLKVFSLSGLVLCEQRKITPFITCFILQKHGTTA